MIANPAQTQRRKKKNFGIQRKKIRSRSHSSEQVKEEARSCGTHSSVRRRRFLPNSLLRARSASALRGAPERGPHDDCGTSLTGGLT